MRLIDADKVKQYALTEGFYCDTVADREATAEKIDELFPTVDAIPIEWLEDLAQQYNISSFYIRQADKKEADRQDWIVEVIDLVIEWWRERK